MGQILVRNLKDEAVAYLRGQAKRNHRSLEAEVRVILEAQAEAEAHREAALARREAFWRRADEIRASMPPDQTDSAELRRLYRRGEEDL